MAEFTQYYIVYVPKAKATEAQAAQRGLLNIRGTFTTEEQQTWFDPDGVIVETRDGRPDQWCVKVPITNQGGDYTRMRHGKTQDIPKQTRTKKGNA